MATIFANHMQWSSANLNLHICADSKSGLVGGNPLILLCCGLRKEILLLTKVGFFVVRSKKLTSNLFKATIRFPLEQVE